MTGGEIHNCKMCSRRGWFQLGTSRVFFCSHKCRQDYLGKGGKQEKEAS
jgi:hypothetical protein